MGATLNQPCRVRDEGVMRRKPLLEGNKSRYVYRTEGTLGISTG
jgi:hypothetical protein